MYWTFFPQNSNIENTNMLYIINTFQALVDTIIPRTPLLAQEYGLIQYYGALDADIDQYMIISLQNLFVPSAGYAVEILDTAARLVYTEGYENNPQTDEISFSNIPPEKRLQALEFLLMASTFPASYPGIFMDYSDLVLYIYGYLNRSTMFGYYSEWFGYGNTRLLPPEQRLLEFYPFSWEQIDYPGPSLGYHALRNTT
ncbi:hypothetical protein [Anaerocolumna xylanovorans]|uniref:Gluconate 2-dehydrogenase subunit 3 n=1 Tax=Anaerocolumna xylanovorans DSM 12503 TaxID=1121345 RepID=A0A1M7Y1L2_9FIRM|nr:hypothetical protein [Anaerocolumna xylanovorans]SHO45528.1 hypothetical protein SAMN02745217_00985 [Anaerocolumna xylanovorans DSM 12503]